MEKVFKVADIRDLEQKVALGEISYSRMVEMLNEKAEEHYSKVKKLNEPAVIGSLPSDVEDYIVKTSAYFDNDFKMKGNKEIEDKLKRHSDRLIAKYAS